MDKKLLFSPSFSTVLFTGFTPKMFNFATALRFSLLGAALATSSLERRQQAPQAQPGQPGQVQDVPADAKSLPLTCQDSIYISGMTAEFKQANPQVDQYHVALKLSASPNDVQDVIAKNGLTALQTYTKDYDRGFVAKLNYGQLCTLDKDSRVGTISVCAGPNACAPEDRNAKAFPGPSANSGIKGAPNVQGLSEQCAKVVWYTITEYDAATVVPDEYVAVVKVWVTPKEAQQYFSSQPGYKQNPMAEANGYFSGKWNHDQLCAIERSPLVAWVETMEAPPPGGQPGAQQGPPLPGTPQQRAGEAEAEADDED